MAKLLWNGVKSRLVIREVVYLGVIIHMIGKQ